MGHQAEQEGNEERVRMKGTAERGVGRWGGEKRGGHHTNSSAAAGRPFGGRGERREGGSGSGSGSTATVMTPAATMWLAFHSIDLN